MSRAYDNVKSDKIKALSLAKECYAMKLELLTNATVVDDAIRFVGSHAVLRDKANSDYSVTTAVLNECRHKEGVCNRFI
jgi:hypothetical protein